MYDPTTIATLCALVTVSVWIAFSIWFFFQTIGKGQIHSFNWIGKILLIPMIVLIEVIDAAQSLWRKINK